MHFIRAIKLITRFYGNIFLANFLVTLSCVYLLRLAGKNAQSLVFVFFWYKIISMMFIFYTAIYYKKNELYYYQNLGVTKLRLVLTTSGFDFLAWLIFVLLQLITGLSAPVFNYILWGVLLIHAYAYYKK